jgi:hypothetical protein
VVALLAGTAIEVGDKVSRNQRVADDVAREVDAVHATVRGRALVIVPDGPDGAYVLHPRGALSNDPDLSDTTLFAADLGGRNLDLFDRFPDRAVYRFDTVDGRPQIDTLHRARAASLPMTVHATPVPGRAVFMTYAAVEGEADHVCVVDRAASPDRPIAAPVLLASTSVTLQGCEGGDVTVPLPDGPSRLVIGAASSNEAQLATGAQVESRYWTNVRDGQLEVATPGETWTWNPGDDFTLVPPGSERWVSFDL